MQSMMEATSALSAQITAMNIKIQNLATVAGDNAAVATSASTFAMTPGLKVEDIIDYCDKVVLSLWKAAIGALPTKFDINHQEWWCLLRA